MLRGSWTEVLRGVVLGALVAAGSAGCPSRARGPIEMSAPEGREWVYAAELDRYIVEDMEERSLPSSAVVVLQDGHIVYARGYGEASVETGAQATPHTFYAIGSLTKTFTAALVLRLRDEGRLGLSDVLWSRLPASIHVDRASRTRPTPLVQVADVLSHVAGFPRLPPNLKSQGTDKYGGFSCSSLAEALRTVEFEHLGRREYVYSNFGFSVLGMVVENVTGEEYASALERYVLDPLHLEDTFVSYSRSPGERMAQGYGEGDGWAPQALWKHGCLAPQGALVSTPMDMAKWVQFWLQGDGGNVLRSRTMAEAITPLFRTDRSTDATLLTPGELDACGGADCGEDTEDAVTLTVGGHHEPLPGGVRRIGRRLPSTPWIGLGWHLRVLEDERLVVEHAGLVGGFGSYIAYSPTAGVGYVVLVNRQVSMGAKGARVMDWLLDLPREPGVATAMRPPLAGAWP